MRKLRRRALTWRRYADKTWRRGPLLRRNGPPGHRRAHLAVVVEHNRRWPRVVDCIDCGGPDDRSCACVEGLS